MIENVGVIQMAVMLAIGAGLFIYAFREAFFGLPYVTSGNTLVESTIAKTEIGKSEDVQVSELLINTQAPVESEATLRQADKSSNQFELDQQRVTFTDVSEVVKLLDGTELLRSSDGRIIGQIFRSGIIENKAVAHGRISKQQRTSVKKNIAGAA